MKKIILFLLLSISIFANWEVINYTDDFGDPMKENHMVSSDYDYDDVILSVAKLKTNFSKREKNGNIIKTKELKQQLFISLDLPDYIGTFQDNFNEINVKIKNDKEQVLSFNAYTSRDGYSILFKYENSQKLIEFMKKSETIKVTFYDYEGNNYLFNFDVTGYLEAEKELTILTEKY